MSPVLVAWLGSVIRVIPPPRPRLLSLNGMLLATREPILKFPPAYVTSTPISRSKASHRAEFQCREHNPTTSLGGRQLGHGIRTNRMFIITGCPHQGQLECSMTRTSCPSNVPAPAFLVPACGISIHHQVTQTGRLTPPSLTFLSPPPSPLCDSASMVYLNSICCFSLPRLPPWSKLPPALTWHPQWLLPRHPAPSCPLTIRYPQQQL